MSFFKTAPWRYKLESDGGKDRAVREGNDKGNPYLIAYDTGGGGKKWLCVKSIPIIEQMVQQMQAEQRLFYAVIRYDQPSKLYHDIDAKDIPYSKRAEVCDQFFQAWSQFAAEYLIINKTGQTKQFESTVMSADDWASISYISDASKEDKVSLHIVSSITIRYEEKKTSSRSIARISGKTP